MKERSCPATEGRVDLSQRARVRLGLVLLGLTVLGLFSPLTPVSAQMTVEKEVVAVHGPNHTANYQLAARFAPYKMGDMVKSTSVNPNWIEDGDRFWYQWDDTNGTYYYLVDPARGTKRQIFDNDRIAAEITRITGDPWDGQHMGIRSIKFIDDNTLQFEVQSTIDEEIETEVVEEE